MDRRKTRDPERVIDWDRIELDYRAGLKSVRAIAGEHGVDEKQIRRKAIYCKWARDLSARIRSEARAKLLSNEPGKLGRAPKRPDREIISDAADTQVEIVLKHRRDLRKLREISRTLTDRLDAALNGGISEESLAVHLGKDSPAQLLERLVSVTEKLVKLERQAYAIDGDSDPEKPGQVLKIERVIFDAQHTHGAGLPAAARTSPV
jgi:hypothetical protein